ncbi:MAG: hypothetical protein HC913_00430 [Microscillaceae bacterium]|nr:hypothetical protein [Microscillaceae bacterium]
MIERKFKYANSVRRYNYTSNMLIKSENYLFDDIRKGLIHSGDLDADIAQSVSSIQALLEKYHQRNSRFSD